MTLEETCEKYHLGADFGISPAKGPLTKITLWGTFPYNQELMTMRFCDTPFTKADWMGEPVTASRVLLASFSDLMSYWSTKRGQKYFSFSSHRKAELREVSAYSRALKRFLADTLEEFLISAYPDLYVNSHVRDSIRPSVQWKGERKDGWRQRPEPEFEVEGYSEVRLSPFGDDEEESD